MNNGIFTLPPAYNEPVKQYLPGSAERQQLEVELNRQLARVEDIPLIIGGREIRTPDQGKVVCPHDHSKTIAV
ncbi:MAG: 1-pyrroline-5-carboxylate dehydrogenase, partial [Desulfobacteraceae bacterium]|nr:1-pyrroline-5-carboxylate dehydrogenase [Desulfobacteraceae bacterium]